MGLQEGHVPTAIPRRATLSDEVHRENRIKSLLRFDQDSRLKHLARYVSEFEVSRLIGILRYVRGLRYYRVANFLLFVRIFLSYVIFTAVASR